MAVGLTGTDGTFVLFNGGEIFTGDGLSKTILADALLITLEGGSGGGGSSTS